MQKIDLPNIPSLPGVYIWYFKKNRKNTPFYVGISKNIRRRVGDYIIASSATSTDLLVGESIKYLQRKKGISIALKYKIIENDSERRIYEKEKIIQLREKKYHLINREENHGINYHYKKYKKEERKNRVRDVIEDLHKFIDSSIVK